MPLSVEYEQLQVEVLPLSLMERLHLMQWHCQGLTAQLAFAAGSASTEISVTATIRSTALDQDGRK
jgi:hypothetical protein